MKKNYQVPETQIWEMEVSNCILEDSGEIGSGGALTNETNTFEEEDIPTPTSHSLWE
jgi:hypothetical protein